MKIVAVIPCLNEAEHIGSVVAGARKYCDIVVVADNGSVDGTTKEASGAGAIVVNCKAKGLGNNIQTGLNFVVKHNMADIIILMDGDGQHNPDDILTLLKPIKLKLADVVIGDRYQAPVVRTFGLRILTFVFNIGNPIKVNDPMIGFWAISKRVIIPDNVGWGCYVQMLEQYRKDKTRIMSVPVNVRYSGNYSDNSSKPALWLGACLLWNIIKYRFLV